MKIIVFRNFGVYVILGIGWLVVSLIGWFVHLFHFQLIGWLID